MVSLMGFVQHLSSGRAGLGVAIARRVCAWGRFLTLTGLLLGGGGSAWAGAQVDEPLADSVRTALSAAVGKGVPSLTFADEDQRRACERWQDALEPRLQLHVPSSITRRDLLMTACYEARRAGLEPDLVLGLIRVESAFRKFAVSSVGARGYMQVMPFWAKTIGDGDPSHLFTMQTNLRFGCVILRHYLKLEHGDLYMALGRYNGSRGRPEYPRMVMKAWQEMQSASGGVSLARADLNNAADSP